MLSNEFIYEQNSSTSKKFLTTPLNGSTIDKIVKISKPRHAGRYKLTVQGRGRSRKRRGLNSVVSTPHIPEYYGIQEARHGWLIREEERVYEYRVEGKLARKGRRFRLIDVFAGAGGMTLGFSKRFGHAFDPVWANDFDESCVKIRLEHVLAEHF